MTPILSAYHPLPRQGKSERVYGSADEQDYRQPHRTAVIEGDGVNESNDTMTGYPSRYTVQEHTFYADL